MKNLLKLLGVAGFTLALSACAPADDTTDDTMMDDDTAVMDDDAMMDDDSVMDDDAAMDDDADVEVSE